MRGRAVEPSIGQKTGSAFDRSGSELAATGAGCADVANRDRHTTENHRRGRLPD